MSHKNTFTLYDRTYVEVVGAYPRDRLEERNCAGWGYRPDVCSL